MWKYHQSTGLIEHDGAEVDYGWSGYEDGINIPAMQDAPGIGPIPRGMWAIEGPPFDSAETGAYTLILTPALGTQTFGRNSFRWHGRSAKRIFDSSKGCVVSARWIREKAWMSGDRELRVVA